MNSITINLWPYAVLQYNSEHAMVTGSWPRHRHTVQKSIYPKLMAKILGMAKIWQGQMSFLHACRIGIGNAQDLYLAGRLLPKNGHFQLHGDGSSSFQKDGVRLVTVYGFCRVCPFFFGGGNFCGQGCILSQSSWRYASMAAGDKQRRTCRWFNAAAVLLRNLRLDPGTSKSPLGGDNDLVVTRNFTTCRPSCQMSGSQVKHNYSWHFQVNLAGYSCSKFFGALAGTAMFLPDVVAEV